MKTAIVNLATIVTGDWRRPFAKGDAILMNKGRITKVGSVTAKDMETCDVELDAGGMTAMPGMIDSQVHVAFADYTPRQRAIGFLESYLHGGTTTSISNPPLREAVTASSRMRRASVAASPGIPR